MTYKGYRIVINYPAIHFYDLDDEGDQTERVEGINYESHDTEGWYSVVGEDNWVEHSFESIAECEEYIDGEVDDK